MAGKHAEWSALPSSTSGGLRSGAAQENCWAVSGYGPAVPLQAPQAAGSTVPVGRNKPVCRSAGEGVEGVAMCTRSRTLSSSEDSKPPTHNMQELHKHAFEQKLGTEGVLPA